MWLAKGERKMVKPYHFFLIFFLLDHEVLLGLMHTRKTFLSHTISNDNNNNNKKKKKKNLNM